MFLQLYIFPEFVPHFSSPGYENLPNSILTISYLRQRTPFPVKSKGKVVPCA
jgi:hypothetical protein